MEAKNDLVALNEILFDTLRGLKKGEITLEKAKTVSAVGTTIVNSNKVQVSWFKSTQKKPVQGKIMGLPPAKEKVQDLPKNVKDIKVDVKEDELTLLKIDFAKKKGFKTIAAAVAGLGSWKFEQQFKTYIQNN